MNLRVNLGAPTVSAFYPLFTEIFEPPLSVNFGKLQPPPLGRGGVRAMIQSLINPYKRRFKEKRPKNRTG